MAGSKDRSRKRTSGIFFIGKKNFWVANKTWLKWGYVTAAATVGSVATLAFNRGSKSAFGEVSHVHLAIHSM